MPTISTFDSAPFSWLCGRSVVQTVTAAFCHSFRRSGRNSGAIMLAAIAGVLVGGAECMADDLPAGDDRESGSPAADGADDTALPELITVTRTDGRTLTGRVAVSTDDECLRLVLASSRISVTTAIAWTQIARVDVADGSQSAAQFQIEWRRWALPGEPLLLDAGPRHPAAAHGGLLHGLQTSPATVFDQLHATASPVTSIAIFAQAANWDRDAEADGLLVEITALDGLGRIMPVSGTVDARLIGLEQQITGGRSTLDRSRYPVRELERWSVPVRAADHVDGRLLVRLPFRRLRPEQDLDTAPHAVLDVKLKVASVGVFQASQPDVLIRQPSHFRDDLQLISGRRQLPLERPTRQPQRDYLNTSKRITPARP